MRKSLVFVLLVLFCFSVGSAYAANGKYDATSGLDWVLFKKYNSPAFIPNVNGLLTMPIAQTIGKGRVGLGVRSIEAGELSGTKVYYSNGTIFLGSSDDVELGYSKKALIYSDDMSRSDIGGANFYLKIKILDLGDLVPKVAFGVMASSLTDETNLTKYNTFMDAFGVASIMFNVWETRWGLHAGIESGFIGDNQTDKFLFGGLTITLFDFVNLCGEYVGAKATGEEGVMNASAGVKLFDILNINVNKLDMNSKDKSKTNTSAQAMLTIKFI